MRVRLKGINSIRKCLADGTLRTYWYAWKGGPPLVGDPGSPEFVKSYWEAHDSRAAEPGDQLSTILDAYQDSEAFRSLAPRTAEDYRRYLAAIGREFGDFPLSGLAERDARAEFMRWRDSVAKRSKRTADYGWSILARVMSWALDRGLVTTNPCGKGGRVYRASRADNIWTDADEAAFLAVASPQMRLAFMLAMWTGQRQGDILRLTWTAYDSTHIRLTQQKTGRRVIAVVGAPLKSLLEVTQRRSPQIVTNEDGHPFTSSGFRASFRAAQARAGIKGLLFTTSAGARSHAWPNSNAPNWKSPRSLATRARTSDRSSTRPISAGRKCWATTPSGSSKQERSFPTNDPTTSNCSMPERQLIT